jgi:hypothetical protein
MPKQKPANPVLHGFLYLMIRDHVSFGAVEMALAQAEKAARNPGGVKYSESLQSKYCVTLAKRLLSQGATEP